MRYSLHITIGLLLPIAGQAQLEVGTNVRTIGTTEERRIDGLAAPTMNSSAITVESSFLGVAHWADASIEGSTITLDQSIDLEEYRPGVLLRFVCPATIHGAIMLRTSGLTELPLLRSDGHAPARGQLLEGAIIEVMNAGDSWILLGPAERICPPGSAPVHAGLCMETIPTVSNTSIYNAIDVCLQRGGKLCTWDEYYLGCTVLGDQLEMMFQAWEWIDDTSNHTHTGEQAGRTTCRSQRSVNPVLVSSYGQVRCCYHLR